MTAGPVPYPREEYLRHALTLSVGQLVRGGYLPEDTNNANLVTSLVSVPRDVVHLNGDRIPHPSVALLKINSMVDVRVCAFCPGVEELYVPTITNTITNTLWKVSKNVWENPDNFPKEVS